jgi:tetratricopeptide (TPR) repeat protein
MLRRSFFPALALALLPALAPAAQNNVIRGKVRAAGGVSVNNAIVELKRGGSGMIGQTVTRNDGDFAFSGLAAAEYEITVSLAGFEPTTEIVRFRFPSNQSSMEVLNVEVMLRPRADAVALAPPGTSFAQEVPKAAREAYDKALGRLRENKPAEAVALLRQAITLFDDYFDAHYHLGLELYRAGEYPAALETLERARQINDRQPGVYHAFGLVMIKQQKFNVADYAFREAIRLDANNAASHFYRGAVLIEVALRGADRAQRAADLAEAEKMLDRAWELSNKRAAPVLLQRARVYEIRGEKEAAASALDDYLKAEPGAKNAAEIRATIRRLRGQNK